MAVMAAAAGAYVHIFTDILHGGGILLSLVGLGLALGSYLPGTVGTFDNCTYLP